jgi:hypothetical protein
MARRKLTRKCIKVYIQNAEPAPTKVEGYKKRKTRNVKKGLRVGRQTVSLIADAVYLPARTRVGGRRRIKRNAATRVARSCFNGRSAVKRGGNEGRQEAKVRGGLRIDKRYQYYPPLKPTKYEKSVCVWKRSDREWHTPLPSFARFPASAQPWYLFSFIRVGIVVYLPVCFLFVITTLCPLIDAFFSLMVIFQGPLSLGVMSSPNLAGPRFSRLVLVPIQIVHEDPLCYACFSKPNLQLT